MDPTFFSFMDYFLMSYLKNICLDTKISILFSSKEVLKLSLLHLDP